MGRTWETNKVVEFTQNLEKPDNCLCDFPNEVLSGLTGHRPGCPVFDSWTKRVGQVIYTPLISAQEFEQLVRLTELVQANQDFFGDPPAGKLALKLVADKLEKLIEANKADQNAYGHIKVTANGYWKWVAGD